MVWCKLTFATVPIAALLQQAVAREKLVGTKVIVDFADALQVAAAALICTGHTFVRYLLRVSGRSFGRMRLLTVQPGS